MSSLDVLFWLLIVLLGGVGWAIEAGLASRHRNLLCASTVSAFATLVFFMFWLDDESAFQLAPRPTKIHRHGGANGATGGFEAEDDGSGGTLEGQNQGSGDDSGGGNGGAGDGGMASGNGGGAGGSGGGGGLASADSAGAVSKKKKEENKEPPAYSREPFRDCKNCPELVIIARDPETGLPAKTFAVGRLEITRKEFTLFVQSAGYAAAENCDVQSARRGKFSWRNPGFEQDGRHPAVCISPKDADAYVDWIAERAGRKYHLMTNEEWEIASRAGTDTPYWQGDAVTPAQANFGHSRDGTIPAGSLPANPYGLSDTSGNVWEILGSCAGEPAPGTKNTGAVCTERVVKGGGWNSNADQLRSDAKLSLGYESSTNYIGFRVARDVDAKDKDKILSKAKRAELAADEKAAAAIEAKERAEAEKAEHDRIEAEAQAALPKPPASATSAKK